MNRIAYIFTALAVVAVLTIPLSGREQILDSKASARASAPWQEKNPYAAIFITQDKQKPDVQKKSAPSVQAVPGRVVADPPRVVCGMTVVQTNPDVDPKILQKSEGGSIDYKIRSMPSPICR